MANKIPLGGVVLKIKYPDSYTNLCQILIGLSLNVLNLEVVKLEMRINLIKYSPSASSMSD